MATILIIKPKKLSQCKSSNQKSFECLSLIRKLNQV